MQYTYNIYIKCIGIGRILTIESVAIKNEKNDATSSSVPSSVVRKKSKLLLSIVSLMLNTIF